ncbi:MAG: hypothetical protein WCS38_05055 [Mesotoga sp.]|uniref:hypothetical protein n=1 Tax=Mesotoga sp. TaxID=2053577 RepID=UPI003569116D
MRICVYRSGGETEEIFDIRFEERESKRVFAEVYRGCYLLIRGEIRVRKNLHKKLREFTVTTRPYDRDLDIDIPRILTRIKSDYF